MYCRDASGVVQPKVFLPFEQARMFVRSLELGSHADWVAWCKSGARPGNIPSGPADAYRRTGWVSYPDWMGYTVRTPEWRYTAWYGEGFDFWNTSEIRYGIVSRMEFSLNIDS